MMFKMKPMVFAVRKALVELRYEAKIQSNAPTERTEAMKKTRKKHVFWKVRWSL